MPVQFPYPTTGWSTGEMRTLRKAKGQKQFQPDFDYAFGATAGPKGEPTAAQQAYDQKAPKVEGGQAVASPSDDTMAMLLMRGAPKAATVLGKQLAGEAPTQEAPLSARQQQLRYEMEAGYQSKITPEEFKMFNAEMDRWQGMSQEERDRIRKGHKDREAEDDAKFQMSPNQLRQQGVTPGPQ